MMKSKVLIKLAIGIVVIGGGVSYLMYQAIKTSSSYYYSVDDFMGGSDKVYNSSLRLAGKVKPGSVSRDMEKMLLSFVIQGSKAELPVSYKGVVPDNFAEDIEVVVEGQLDTAGNFNAQTLMTRCESKYKAKVN